MLGSTCLVRLQNLTLLFIFLPFGVPLACWDGKVGSYSKNHTSLITDPDKFTTRTLTQRITSRTRRIFPALIMGNARLLIP